jgi:uncharacterized repeat protein (TIGR01451 family)
MDNKKNAWKSITVIAIVLTMFAIAMVGTASAKSLYLASHNDQIRAYDIGADGYTLTYQYSGTPNEHDPVGLALDGEHTIPILFITFEGSGYVQIMNANTMASLGIVTAPGSSNLAGIVYDQDNDRMYCVDRGKSKLYVYDWNYSTSTLSAVSGSPFTICSGTYGIALDQTNNKLYVATSSTTIYVYDLNADGNPFSISPAGTISTIYTAISVAVDEGNQYLYYGAGFAGNYYLSQYDITTPGHTHYYIADNEGVMGLGVDQDNHNVYISTVSVFDSSLNLLNTTSAGVSRPTGLVIPRAQISYNPLNLSKVDDIGTCVYTGDNINYGICYDNSLNTFDVHNVTIIDTVPENVSFVSASGGGTYNSVTHTVTWNIGTVTAGAPEACVTLVVRVNAGAENTTLTNCGRIDSDETGPTTQCEDTNVCAGPPSPPAVPVPGLTPIGLIALVGLLSVIAAISIRKKRS